MFDEKRTDCSFDSIDVIDSFRLVLIWQKRKRKKVMRL